MDYVKSVSDYLWLRDLLANKGNVLLGLPKEIYHGLPTWIFHGGLPEVVHDHSPWIT